ncbi:hypothetical protein [Thiomonas sp.]|uniref:Uncharacterized protein n=1 Tax=mine drainage metagenome TaxID=410659 RepID=E6PS98_9ZZZZ
MSIPEGCHAKQVRSAQRAEAEFILVPTADSSRHAGFLFKGCAELNRGYIFFASSPPLA